MKQEDAKEIELDPDKRDWEYDGDGTKIYKANQGYVGKTIVNHQLSNNFQALKMQLNRIEEKLDHIITSKLSTK
tara:strand:- start:640 stop:861 length:222 start_codon:yes stop_codon:yes gene_type:complete